LGGEDCGAGGGADMYCWLGLVLVLALVPAQ
jgi:hypothetical protein